MLSHRILRLIKCNYWNFSYLFSLKTFNYPFVHFVLEYNTEVWNKSQIIEEYCQRGFLNGYNFN